MAFSVTSAYNVHKLNLMKYQTYISDNLSLLAWVFTISCLKFDHIYVVIPSKIC